MTLIREDVLQSWSKAHPDWPHSIGAVGPANEGTDPDVFLLRIPILQLGPFTVNRVVAASRPNKIYSATSYETPAAIIGALGENVLSRRRARALAHSETRKADERNGGRITDTLSRSKARQRQTLASAKNSIGTNMPKSLLESQAGQ